MASTEKVILLMVFINLVIVLATQYGIDSANNAATGYNSFKDALDEFNENAEERKAQIEEDSNWFQRLVGSTTDFVEGAFDTGKMAVSFIWIFTKSLLPFTFSLTADSSELNVAETLIVYAINFFRSTLLALIGLEIFLVWRNRKTGG